MKPILLEFPQEFETQRLHIRLPLPGDGAVVHESIEASRKELKEWMPFAQSEQSVEDVEENIRDSYTDFLSRKDLRLLVFHKENGAFIGSSGLHRIDWDVRKFEIGYWMDTRHSGAGYMTEAVEGITNFAFEQLHAKRVEIRCDTKNERSKRIPERLDFPLEGILRNEARSLDGKELRDTFIYAKTRK